MARFPTASRAVVRSPVQWCQRVECAGGVHYARLESRGSPLLSFPPFQLDLGDERLLRDGKELRLRRKPFAILRHLVLHPHRVVTHDEVVEAVWGRVAMSESLLRTHVHD